MAKQTHVHSLTHDHDSYGAHSHTFSHEHTPEEILNGLIGDASGETMTKPGETSDDPMSKPGETGSGQSKETMANDPTTETKKSGKTRSLWWGEE